jgi:hypothetical protein
LALFLATGTGVIAAGSTSKTESESSGTKGSELKGTSALHQHVFNDPQFTFPNH